MKPILKECDVVMLPTNAKVHNGIWKDQIYSDIFIHNGISKRNDKPQHLYITTDEQVKVGDLFIVELFKITGDSDGLYLEQCRSINDIWVNEGEVDEVRHIKNCKKIVATTDPKLCSEVAKIPESFIKEYVEKEGKIDEVMIEYKQEEFIDRGIQSMVDLLPKLKLTSKGEVVIHPFEEKMYTKEEVIHIADEWRSHYGYMVSTSGLVESVKEWFNENY